MKSNLRNEIKAYIVRSGCTMQEVVDLLSDEHGWSDSVSNLSNKLQRESLRYTEAVQLADALGHDIVWQRRTNRDSRPYRKQRAVCDGQSAKIFRVIADAKELRPDVGTQLFGLDMEKRWGRFSISSGGHRNARNPPRRAHGTLQPFGMKVL